MRVHVRSSFVRWCSNPFKNASSVRRSGRPTGQGRHTHTPPRPFYRRTRVGPARPRRPPSSRYADEMGVSVCGDWEANARPVRYVTYVRLFVRCLYGRPVERGAASRVESPRVRPGPRSWTRRAAARGDRRPGSSRPAAEAAGALQAAAGAREVAAAFSHPSDVHAPPCFGSTAQCRSRTRRASPGDRQAHTPGARLFRTR